MHVGLLCWFNFHKAFLLNHYITNISKQAKVELAGTPSHQKELSVPSVLVSGEQHNPSCTLAPLSSGRV